VIAENVLALREAERVFLDALWICDTKLVIADDTSLLAFRECVSVNTLELADCPLRCDTPSWKLSPYNLLRPNSIFLRIPPGSTEMFKITKRLFLVESVGLFVTIKV